MGLDFQIATKGVNSCTAHWSYSGFNRFRFRIGQQIGIKLCEMEGYEGSLCPFFDTEFECKTCKQNKREINNDPKIPWESIKDDIKFLLNHCDCEGYIIPKKCGKIARRLETMITWWENDYDKIQAMELCRAMKLAFNLNKRLIFC